jgi:hypothetical protein
MTGWDILAAGPGLGEFNLTEYGIFGVIIGALALTVRHLYSRIATIQEKYETREAERNEKFYQLVLNMHNVMAETLLYLKFVHDERTGHYEEHLKTLQQLPRDSHHGNTP